MPTSPFSSLLMKGKPFHVHVHSTRRMCVASGSKSEHLKFFSCVRSCSCVPPVSSLLTVADLKLSLFQQQFYSLSPLVQCYGAASGHELMMVLKLVRTPIRIYNITVHNYACWRKIDQLQRKSWIPPVCQPFPLTPLIDQ